MVVAPNRPLSAKFPSKFFLCKVLSHWTIKAPDANLSVEERDTVEMASYLAGACPKIV